MSRIVYVNGSYVAEEQAKVSVFDRGFLFADAIYEVSSVLAGKLIDNASHLARLKRSLDAIGIQSPASDEEITSIQQQLIEKNDLDEGLVYLQVSRGAADRDFLYPQGVSPTLVLFTQEKNLRCNPKAESGLSIVTLSENRWGRRDIKSVGLLPACMAKNLAVAQGADDAWFLEDGFVTEGSSHNAYIVTADDQIITRHLGSEILAGITREAVLGFAADNGFVVEERAFTAQEAYQAKEAFITSATTFVLPVNCIDGNTIGDGKPGSITRRLRTHYIEHALSV